MEVKGWRLQDIGCMHSTQLWETEKGNREAGDVDGGEGVEITGHRVHAQYPTVGDGERK